MKYGKSGNMIGVLSLLLFGAILGWGLPLSSEAAPQWFQHASQKAINAGELRQGMVYYLPKDEVIVIDDTAYTFADEVEILDVNGSQISKQEINKGDFISFILDKKNRIVLIHKEAIDQENAGMIGFSKE